MSFDGEPDEGLFVVGIDPGETTGWAVLWIPTANVLSREIGLMEDLEYNSGQLTGLENQQVNCIRDVILYNAPNGPLIIEDFVLRQFRQDRALLSPVRLTAKIELMHEYEGWGELHPIRKQQPSLAKSTATDARLREWGMYDVGTPHARDAVRHAMTFLRRAKTDRKLARWAWPSVEWERLKQRG